MKCSNPRDRPHRFSFFCCFFALIKCAFLLFLQTACRHLQKSRFQAANQPLATEMRVGSNPDWTYSVQRAPPPVGQYGNNTRHALRGPFVHFFGLRSSVWLHFLPSLPFSILFSIWSAVTFCQLHIITSTLNSI